MIEIGCLRVEINSEQSIFMPFCCKKLSKVANLGALVGDVAD